MNTDHGRVPEYINSIWNSNYLYNKVDNLLIINCQMKGISRTQ